MASLFVMGVSAWYLLKKRDVLFAKRSIVVSASFGLITSLFLLSSGDESAYNVAQTQPMKLAAMEGLYKGENRAGIIAIGLLNQEKEAGDELEEFHFKVEIPSALSFLGYHDLDAFVPGIEDMLYGNPDKGVMSISEKMEKGKIAVEALRTYKDAKKAGDDAKATEALKRFEAHQAYMGYGYLEKPEDAIPNVSLSFYSFHIMVGLGTWFLVLFALALFFARRDSIASKRCLLWAMVATIPMGYMAQEAGWIVAEVGRQPWAIQDLLPVGMATSNVASTSVMITFWLFAILFTGLLIAEIKIMLTQIKMGPEGGH
jgi:cytochrome d ubiquinol oxidase subunit I